MAVSRVTPRQPQWWHQSSRSTTRHLIEHRTTALEVLADGSQADLIQMAKVVRSGFKK